MSELKPIELKPFQFRALRCLYESPHYVRELNTSSNQSWSANSVKHFRDNGIDIYSEWTDNVYNPASRRKIVKYHLADESRELARLSLIAHQPNLKLD